MVGAPSGRRRDIDHRGDVGTAAGQARGDALVGPAAGRSPGHQLRDRGPDLDPSTKAVAVWIGERTQIQALDCTAPILAIRPGVAEKQTCDCVRNGTTALFAGLEITTGLVTDRCCSQHANAGFRSFL